MVNAHADCVPLNDDRRSQNVNGADTGDVADWIYLTHMFRYFSIDSKSVMYSSDSDAVTIFPTPLRVIADRVWIVSNRLTRWHKMCHRAGKN